MQTRSPLSYLLAALLATLLVSGASAGNSTDEVLDEVDQTVDDLIGHDPTGLDGVLEDLGEGVGDAQRGAGDLLGQALAAVGDALLAVGSGITLIGTAVAGAFGTITIGLARGFGSLGIGIGESVTGLVAWTGGLAGSGLAAVGTGVATAAGGYADLVKALRPDAMPPVAFGAVVASGAAGSSAAGGWAGWNVLKRWGMVAGGLGSMGVAGFSRIADDQLLEHPVRSQIFTTIQTHPGIHASQLAREVGVGWGTVSHHLDKLQKGNMVATRKVNNQKCFFEQGGAVGRGEMEVASAVKGDTAGKVAAFVHGHPMTSQKSMAEALDISPALASFHVRKLVNLGVLDKMRHGRETLLSTSEAMRRLIESDRNVAAAFEARKDLDMDYSA